VPPGNLPWIAERRSVSKSLLKTLPTRPKLHSQKGQTGDFVLQIKCALAGRDSDVDYPGDSCELQSTAADFPGAAFVSGRARHFLGHNRQ
jgi:hypothetical protein